MNVTVPETLNERGEWINGALCRGVRRYAVGLTKLRVASGMPRARHFINKRARASRDRHIGGWHSERTRDKLCRERADRCLVSGPIIGARTCIASEAPTLSQHCLATLSLARTLPAETNPARKIYSTTSLSVYLYGATRTVNRIVTEMRKETTGCDFYLRVGTSRF